MPHLARPARRAGLGLGLLAAAAVGATACGGSSSSSAAGGAGAQRAALLTKAAAATSAAGSAKLSLTIGGSAAGSTVNATGSGVEDFAHKAADLTLNLTGATQGQLEVREVNGIAYLKLPSQLGGAISGGKPWISIDPAKIGAGSALSGLSSLSSDPTQSFALLNSASDSVTKVGSESVHGQPSTHYKATIDLDKAAASNPQVSAVATQLKQALGTAQLPVDVWIDDKGRITRFTEATGSAGSTAAPSATVSVDVYDYGTPVTVAAPPASDVTDVTNRLGSGSTGTAS
jgi:LppX_LprAFG lipoprotein